MVYVFWERRFEQPDILTNMVILRLTRYLCPECGRMHLQPLESRACWLPWSRAWLSSVWAGRKLPSLPCGKAEAEDVQKVGSKENMQLQDGTLKMRLKATVLAFWPQVKITIFWTLNPLQLWLCSLFGLVWGFGGVQKNNCTFIMMIYNTQLRIIGINIMALLDYWDPTPGSNNFTI